MKGIFVVLACGVLTGCRATYKDDEIPAYLHIKNFSIQTDYSTQGTNSSNITDVWVFVNDNIIGVFELPATVPVLQEGSQKLSLLAGIKKNGISNQRDDYFFYKSHEMKHTFIRGRMDSLYPVTTYAESADFVWFEDFEDLTFKLDTSSQSKTKLFRTTDSSKVFEGKSSGEITLNSENSYFEANSAGKFKLSGNGLSVYLEMDYRCNQAFEVVLWGYMPNLVISEVQAVVIQSTTKRYGDKYNKIYIDLAPAIGRLNQATEYKIALNATYDKTQTEGKIFIDNLKIVQ